ncbi:hypothetical protein [Calothrix sp. PCC 6303]|uniref:hypothetical protein n=1 Tax=Calothrix sp. PCC 6303 TaxID=1170562 RepID=UPI0002A03D99|nr:hypothetical protein [Calothrix sp. PCC 6303]AFZ03254.1 hypothetical protein Cal6303_4347 [Calothrix sp. PCC 6303]
MLVFFIHGVAESKTHFADPLKTLIRKEFSQKNLPLPYFHSGFHADIFRHQGTVWNFVSQDLELIKNESPHINSDEIFRGQEFRQGFLSAFVGDALTYMNSDRGEKIRKSITEHLEDYINNYPQEKELHIITHSMGSIIFWDMLFSDRFNCDDSAYKFRSIIGEKIQLKSIATMGSPILLFNLMLDIKPEIINDRVDEIVAKYPNGTLRWVNIIHASDLIAYPIASSLRTNEQSRLLIQDKFIATDANNLEKMIHNLIKSPVIKAATASIPDISQILSLAAVSPAVADAHTGYWNCKQTADILVKNILEFEEELINIVIARLQKVAGMTTALQGINNTLEKVIPNAENVWQSITIGVDKVVENIYFSDKSGILRLRNNIAQVPHVSVYDYKSNPKFRGYVGLIHAEGLIKEINFIKQNYCK